MWKKKPKAGAQNCFYVTHHIFDGREDLSEGDLAGVVRQFSLVADPVVEVSSSRVLQHQVEAARHLHHLVQTHHVGVPEHLHAADLPGEQTLGLRVQPCLIQDLQGDFVYGRDKGKDREPLHKATRQISTIMDFWPMPGAKKYTTTTNLNWSYKSVDKKII